MNYKIVILKHARKFIEKQDKKTQEKLLRGIFKLPEGDTKMLKGHSGIYRLRVDGFRVIYAVDNDVVTITVIDIEKSVVNIDNIKNTHRNFFIIHRPFIFH